MKDTGALWLVLLVAAVLPLVFAALWFGILHMMALSGGWKRLARAYAADKPPPPGARLRNVTAMVGIARYKRALQVTTTPDGIYLVPRWIFHPAHPPLFIPFAAIRNARKQTLFFWDYVAFDIGEPVIASMRLPSRVFVDTPVAVER